MFHTPSLNDVTSSKNTLPYFFPLMWLFMQERIPANRTLGGVLCSFMASIVNHSVCNKVYGKKVFV